ncbi:MAG: DMT family transporter [Rhodospirillales bacterium]
MNTQVETADTGETTATLVRGVSLALLAFFLFDSMGAIVKYLGADYPAQQMSMYRNLFGLIPSMLVLAFSASWHAAGRPIIIRQWRLGLLRGAFIAVAQYCFYSSLVHLEFATAVTLSFIAPVFVTALSVPILKTRVGMWSWIAVAVGFSGVLMVMRPGTEIFDVYSVLPLGAALGYALAAVTVRRLDDDVPNATVNLYSTVGALFGATVFVLSTDGYVPVASAHDWMWIVIMGCCGGLAVLALVGAYRTAPPSSIAPFEYFGIPISFTIGYVIFDEAPFDTLFPGVLFIVGGGLLIFWRQGLRDKRARESEQAENQAANAWNANPANIDPANAKNR